MAHHQALAARDADRLAELTELRSRLAYAEASAHALRAQLASRLYYWHEDGVPVGALAKAAGMTD
jgi:hypothetical protein